MSLAEIEKQVLNLSQADRRKFARWFYQNEGEFVNSAPNAEQEDAVAAIAPEVMAELVRRRQELEDGSVRLITVEELEAGMREAVDEVRRSRH
jgi:hypothetical protein